MPPAFAPAPVGNPAGTHQENYVRAIQAGSLIGCGNGRAVRAVRMRDKVVGRPPRLSRARARAVHQELRHGMAGSHPAPSAWAPLRIRAFRELWLAALVSTVGTWMQTVGAQWLLVHQAHAAILVPLVQTAGMLPYVLFGLVGGVLADTFDRRRLLIAVQGGMVVAGTALTVLTAVHQMPPALLLMFTFVLGSGLVLTVPAYQSLVPDLVPRAQVRAASTLPSLRVNLARAVGPAVAGP